MRDTSVLPVMTVEEYFRFEETSPGKYEYIGGEVYAMSSATIDTTGSPPMYWFGCRSWRARARVMCSLATCEVRSQVTDTTIPT